MGVTELWSILSPVQETVPLYGLAGKILAVDLSLWVCEAQHVQGMMGKVTKPHLRNLFFRASSLLRMGVKLVFVMEGEAPKMKAETMSKRTEASFRGVKTKGASKHATLKSTSRGRFKAVLRECAEMLDCLGVPWVPAAGEAEAMCAFLDAQGLVDGCITSDGDAFLYGARTVYRNFNMNTKDPQIDCYRMSRVEAELCLPRETLVGVALLLGCDYLPKGVAGVGKEQALKLIRNLRGQTLLQKFSEWKRTASEPLETAGKKVSHCLVCRHPGSAKSHERNGCVFCDSKRFCQPQDYDSQCPCDWHRSEHTRQASLIETNIKKKTLACDHFPFTEIMEEFLVPKDKPVYSFRRRKPNMPLMQKFALDKMEWPKHYTSEKVLTLMTYAELMNRIHGKETAAQIQPIRIYKRRVRNGIPCFEVLWRKPDDYVFPEDPPPEDPTVVRTVEEENLFSRAYPDLVQVFQKETSETKGSRSRKKNVKVEKEKSTVPPDGLSNLFAQMSLMTSSGLEVVMPPESEQNGTVALQSAADRCDRPTHAAPTSPERPAAGSEIQADPGHRDKLPDRLLGQPACPCPCPTGDDSQVHSSLSVSTVINQLHLSSIDWDALSFTASPSSQCSKTDLRPVKNLDEEARTSDCGSSTACRPDCGELAVLQDEGLSECPLMERILKRNMVASAGLLHPGEHPTRAGLQSTASEDTEVVHGLKSKSNQPLSKGHTVPQSTQYQSGPSRLEAVVSKGRTANPKAQERKERSLDPVPPKSRPAILKHTLMSSVLPQRSSSDTRDGPSSSMELTNQQNACKRSVCTIRGSSSEDSDGENRNRTEEHRTNTNKGRPKLQNSQKPAALHQLTRQNRSRVVSMTQKLKPVHTKQVLASTRPSEHTLCGVFSGTPPHIQKPSKSEEDSDCSVDSPRPLAERLKLKLK